MEAGSYIRGFGACMIDGFPHQPTDSFFHLAVTRLRQRHHQIGRAKLQYDNVRMKRDALALQMPGHAGNRKSAQSEHGRRDGVLRFLRRKKNRDGTTAAAFHGRSVALATLMSRVRWQFQGLVGDLLTLEPVTPVEIYLETIAGLIRTLLENNIIPVVVSPFVFGSRRSDRHARYCARRMQELLATMPKAFFVDSYTALDGHPRHRMLLADGGHLSLLGQQVVGEELLAVLKRIVPAWNAAPFVDGKTDASGSSSLLNYGEPPHRNNTYASEGRQSERVC